LSCFQVNDHFESGGLQYRQIGGVLPSEDASDLVAGVPERLRDAGAVTHETTSLGILPPFIDPRQAEAFGLLDDKSAPAEKEQITTNQQRVDTLLTERLEGCHYIPLAA
jgi:hypothetical protein